MADPRTPILVGVGEVTQRQVDVAAATEPAGLMAEAIRRAAADAGLGPAAVATADSLSVVKPWTWAYGDLPGRLAAMLGAAPRVAVVSRHGGEQCALLADEAARRIAAGTSQLAILTGGEALASLAACQKAGRLPPPGWPAPDPSERPTSTNDLEHNGTNLGSRHAMGLPLHVYAMYENALRARRRQTQAANEAESAALYAAFDRVACAHPASWRFGAAPRDAAAVGTVTARNRMICTPYPLLQNAFNTVNLAAACILTSVAHAQQLGIPRDKWVFVLGGAGTSDREHFWERRQFDASPSLEQAIDAALDAAGVAEQDVDCYDFYSCFPVVPKLACRHLGLSVTAPAKPITLLGGLTSFGGAGNNYSMHAFAEMARQIRSKAVRTGLVLANGAVLTHHYALCFSADPRARGPVYPERNPLPEHLDVPGAPPVVASAEGSATIETYTVVHDRRGRPETGLLVVRLDAGGRRTVANHGDAATLQFLADRAHEPVGARGVLRPSPDGRNLFFAPASKL